jgi:protein JSN1
VLGVVRALGLVPHRTSWVAVSILNGELFLHILTSSELTCLFESAREIQAQEGLTTPNLWGPPASGGSTPLRETIPESPNQDGFPDFMPPSELPTQPTIRRPRAGTVPSRFSPGDAIKSHSPLQSLMPKTSRPTPSTSPFRPVPLMSHDTNQDNKQPSSTTSASALLSRLRAGSMPQRVNYLNSSNPFGSSVFSSGWGSGRERGTTLTSIRSSDGPDSPGLSSFSRDSLADTDVKTLDYLGLAETPQQSRATLVPGLGGLPSATTTPMLQPFLADLASYSKSLNRYRSYSVNAKEKYAEDEEEDYGGVGRYSGLHSGQMTPSAASAAAALAATQAQIHQHNLAVQAFANQASASRPRARTAGVLDSPLRSSGRSFFNMPSRFENSLSAADLNGTDGGEYDGLPEAVRALRLGGQPLAEASEEQSLEGPTRALWLGSIPTSTTVSSLQAIFGVFGKIESTRVLVQKNCGFVNYEDTECAMRARATLNGKEIFPGAGPVRIGYAKAPSASAAGTPSNYGAYPSPSPDPQTKGMDSREDHVNGNGSSDSRQSTGPSAEGATAALQVPPLSELRNEMLRIVQDFGANEHDLPTIAASIDAATSFNRFEPEIPAVQEPSHTRVHDAPKLREIRKRIDNNAISQAEIEEIAIGMLPEISELASDYLGNTVVQKLFEYCSESIKDSMLAEIAPHLAEIGVHKNGTWAAQKIIDVAKTPHQIGMIVEHLRPYTVALFLDQYGNYVLQCCLRFGYPWNNFIFETMLNRLWEIAQGRFGARAMRACLESHHSTKDQQRMLASAIALHSVQLATNANGALLLTWFLDTCTFPHRRTVLAPRLVPHLVHLCTHKVAYLTVLKVINQRNEPEARDTVLQALFFSSNDQTLEDILSDQTCGATLIFKILTTPFFDENMRSEVVQNVRNVLSKIKAAPSQGYKRLMDEVGLSSRVNGKADREHQSSHGGTPYHDRSRPVSQSGSRGPHIQSPMERQNSNSFAPGLGQSQFNSPTNMNMDLNSLAGYDQFGLNSPLYTPNSITSQQMQFHQQALLAASGRGISPQLYGSYPSPSSSFDNNYRPNQASPMSQQAPPMSTSPMLQQSGYAPPGFGPLVGGGIMGGYNPYPVQFFPQQMPQQQQQAGGRRGRVSLS